VVKAVKASQKAMIDTVPALIWRALPDCSRDFHSQPWLNFTGLDANEALGDGWTAAFHPHDGATVLDKWHQSVASGKPFEVEARLRSAEGGYRWFLVRAEPFRDSKGLVRKWYGSGIDIEDRKRATEALRESEEQWRDVFEHNPGMFFMVDATGVVLSVNAVGAAQLGYTADELIGRSVLEVFFPEDRDFVKRNVAICLETLGRSNTWEVRKVRKDGTTLWVREIAKAVRRRENQLIVLIACEDFTERKRAEDALRQREMYLAAAQRISRTGSFGWDVPTSDLIWSDQTFRIFDCDRMVKPTLEFILQRTHPEDRVLVKQFLQFVSQDGKDWDFEHRLLMPDGSVRHIRAAAHAVKHASGGLEFVGAVMDVTATRRAEEDLQKARADLARITRMTTLGELTAAIAHEVNQPLTGLVTSGSACLRWLAADTPDLEAARRSVQRVVSDGRRASDVISRIGALVRKSPPRQDWFSINDTITEGLALVRAEMQQNSIVLRTELSDNLPLVLGDRIQLQQVIINLIANAIEAMSEAGQVQRELLVVSEPAEHGGVVVAVRDSGAGLDAPSLDRLFDAFYTTKPEGMGMGLAISRAIIEAHGGRLWASSNMPQGATFQFSLPVEGGALEGGALEGGALEGGALEDGALEGGAAA
jgi:PAS domain S-box-containing protein